MVGQLGRVFVTTAVLLLGTVVGAWLSLCAACLALEPAERSASNALLMAIPVILLFALAFMARKLFGTQRLAAFFVVVFLGVIATGWLILWISRNGTWIAIPRRPRPRG